MIEGEEFDTTIEDVSRDGDGVARVQGYIVYVTDGIKGEQTRIKIDKVMRSFATAHKI